MNVSIIPPTAFLNIAVWAHTISDAFRIAKLYKLSNVSIPILILNSKLAHTFRIYTTHVNLVFSTKSYALVVPMLILFLLFLKGDTHQHVSLKSIRLENSIGLNGKNSKITK